MSPCPFDAGRSQSGFVLIGVVIFVLALTIIGISLYSLSGYEAGFLERSADGEQAFQSALGGIERAKFALTVPPFSLASVKQNMPQNVVATVAIQDKGGGNLDSTGTVDWSSPDYRILIRVTARVAIGNLDPAGPGYVERIVQGVFDPRTIRNYYSQVVTTLQGITIRPQPGASPPNTVSLQGHIWDASGLDSTSWWSQLAPTYPQTPIIREVVTPPADMAYIAAHQGLAWPAVTVTSALGDSEYVLDAGGGPTAGYFTRPRVDPTNTYSFWSGCPDGSAQEIKPVVTVNGLAVWLFPNGARFNGGVRIRGMGSGYDCLVIVAGPNLSSTGWELDPTVGIKFFGGILADIPVIFVSSGKVVIEHSNNAPGSFEAVPPLSPAGSSGAAHGICVYAGSVDLQGPDQVMALIRDDQLGEMDRAISRLVSQGALPNVSAISDHYLALKPDTWRAWPH